MNRFCEIMREHIRVISAMGDERITKKEILEKKIPGINRNNITMLLNRAKDEGVILQDGKYFILNEGYLRRPFIEFGKANNLLISVDNYDDSAEDDIPEIIDNPIEERLDAHDKRIDKLEKMASTTNKILELIVNNLS